MNCLHYNINPEIPKYIATSIVNISLIIAKDRAFTIKFGTKIPEPLPLKSYGCFFIRDGFTLLAAFSLPTITGKYIHDHSKLSLDTSIMIAQLMLPSIFQFFTTPFHLFGLDFYNHSDGNFLERLNRIRP